MTYTTKVDRPVTVKLVVQYPDGDTHDAEADDIAKFSLVERLKFAESRIDLFGDFMGIDTTDYGSKSRTPEGGSLTFAEVWEAVSLALGLVESFTIYDFANLDHPEYREEAERLARLMGVLPGDPDVVFWDGGKRRCDVCDNRRLLVRKSGPRVAFCGAHPDADTYEVTPAEDVPF